MDASLVWVTEDEANEPATGFLDVVELWDVAVQLLAVGGRVPVAIAGCAFQTFGVGVDFDGQGLIVLELGLPCCQLTIIP